MGKLVLIISFFALCAVIVLSCYIDTGVYGAIQCAIGLSVGYGVAALLMLAKFLLCS